MNIEDQKDQIARIFENVRIDGEEMHLKETEDGRLDAYLSTPQSVMPISFAVQEQTAEEAVIADILSQFIPPDEPSDSISSTVLEITDRTDSIICAFSEHSRHEITSASWYDSPQLNIVRMSTRAMDRFACAWIKWRVKQHKQATDGNFGEIEDHPF